MVNTGNNPAKTSIFEMIELIEIDWINIKNSGVMLSHGGSADEKIIEWYRQDKCFLTSKHGDLIT